MKKIKIAFFNVLMLLFIVASCTNDNADLPTPGDPNADSSALRISINELSGRFNSDGNLNPDENPSGNIIFDFCYSYVYPIELVYNTGTTVTVNSLEDYIDVILSSTEELFINGITYPFDVEVYNESTNSIEVITIANESEYETLVENCEFDDLPAECDDTYDPVCVQINDENGESYIITFDNACWAEEAGFTQNDFITPCIDMGGDNEDNNDISCFEYSFPLSIINENEDTVEVENQSDLNTATYDSLVWSFVYPISIILEDGTTVDINNDMDLFQAFIDCISDNDGDPNSEDIPSCDCTLDPDPVCVSEVIESNDPNIPDETVISQFINPCMAICFGFTVDDFVECE